MINRSLEAEMDVHLGYARHTRPMPIRRAPTGVTVLAPRPSKANSVRWTSTPRVTALII
jgi:hypothetical protein